MIRDKKFHSKQPFIWQDTESSVDSVNRIFVRDAECNRTMLERTVKNLKGMPRLENVDSAMMNWIIKKKIKMMIHSVMFVKRKSARI